MLTGQWNVKKIKVVEMLNEQCNGRANETLKQLSKLSFSVTTLSGVARNFVWGGGLSLAKKFKKYKYNISFIYAFCTKMFVIN